MHLAKTSAPGATIPLLDWPCRVREPLSLDVQSRPVPPSSLALRNSGTDAARRNLRAEHCLQTDVCADNASCGSGPALRSKQVQLVWHAFLTPEPHPYCLGRLVPADAKRCRVAVFGLCSPWPFPSAGRKPTS